MAQIKTEDYVNMAFMKPTEVVLRTHKHDKNVSADALPKGLMLAAKTSINDNKFTPTPIQCIDSDQNFF